MNLKLTPLLTLEIGLGLFGLHILVNEFLARWLTFRIPPAILGVAGALILMGAVWGIMKHRK